MSTYKNLLESITAPETVVVATPLSEAEAPLEEKEDAKILIPKMMQKTMTRKTIKQAIRKKISLINLRKKLKKNQYLNQNILHFWKL